jgi:hypothetical protein
MNERSKRIVAVMRKRREARGEKIPERKILRVGAAVFALFFLLHSGRAFLLRRYLRKRVSLM